MAELAWQLNSHLWRGSVNFKINSRPLFIIICKLKNDNFKTQYFSPLIERVLAGYTKMYNFAQDFQTFRRPCRVSVSWLLNFAPEIEIASASNKALGLDRLEHDYLTGFQCIISAPNCKPVEECFVFTKIFDSICPIRFEVIKLPWFNLGKKIRTATAIF